MTPQGHPTTTAVFRESWASLWARPIASLTISCVIALVCVIALITAGRTSATEREVLESVDSLGTRMVTVVDTTGKAGISSTLVRDVSNVDGVEWVFAIGPAENATLPNLTTTREGVSVVVRDVVGELPPDLHQTSGRAPRPGEGLAGSEAATGLGLFAGTGTAQQRSGQLPIVGQFAATGPLRNLNNTVLTRPIKKSAVPIRYAYVRVATGYDVSATASAVEDVLLAQNPAQVEMEISQGAIELRTVLSGTLGQASRQLLAVTLVVGLALVALSATAAVNARRRDFGRQRAIGATRSGIVALVILQSAFAGLLGTSIGTVCGLTFIAINYGQLPSVAFILGLVGLGLIVATLGAALPAVLAARRDPVRILRVP